MLKRKEKSKELVMAKFEKNVFEEQLGYLRKIKVSEQVQDKLARLSLVHLATCSFAKSIFFCVQQTKRSGKQCTNFQLKFLPWLNFADVN